MKSRHYPELWYYSTPYESTILILYPNGLLEIYDDLLRYWKVVDKDVLKATIYSEFIMEIK